MRNSISRLTIAATLAISLSDPAAAGPKAARQPHAAAPAPQQAAPCARGTWKDDPVCFGEDEKDALPTPSAGSVTSDRPSNAPSIAPTAAINPRPSGPGGGVYQSGVVYQSNGNAVTSNYGGGVKLQLPF